MHRTTDDAHTVVRTYGQLTSPAAFQLFTSWTRQQADDGEILGSVELVEALPDLFHALLSELLSQELLAVAEHAQARIPEGKKHVESKY